MGYDPIQIRNSVPSGALLNRHVDLVSFSTSDQDASGRRAISPAKRNA